eukprot:4316090-Pyramimonas_sp.AAC.1
MQPLLGLQEGSKSSSTWGITLVANATPSEILEALKRPPRGPKYSKNLGPAAMRSDPRRHGWIRLEPTVIETPLQDMRSIAATPHAPTTEGPSHGPQGPRRASNHAEYLRDNLNEYHNEFLFEKWEETE